jgi:flagellar protein FliS
VTPFPRNSNLATYHSVSVRGGVDGADPHALVLMLMDAALQRIAMARGCIERGEIAHKAKLLHSSVTIVAELRGSLNMAEGGTLAQNLSGLYDYMMHRLLLGNVNSDIACLTEVSRLLGDIRAAWFAIAPQVRKSAQRTGAAAWTGATPPAAMTSNLQA